MNQNLIDIIFSNLFNKKIKKQKKMKKTIIILMFGALLMSFNYAQAQVVNSQSATEKLGVDEGEVIPTASFTNKVESVFINSSNFTKITLKTDLSDKNLKTLTNTDAKIYEISEVGKNYIIVKTNNLTTVKKGTTLTIKNGGNVTVEPNAN